MSHDEIHLAWQDTETRRWYPVGRFAVHEDEFLFEYLPKAQNAREDASFSGVPQFPEFAETYRSKQLFPFLKNRLIHPERYDFKQQQCRLGMESVTGYDDPLDVFEILARTGGRRQTDNFEFFRPLRPKNGELRSIFFSRGLSYVDDKNRQFWAEGS